MPFLNELIDRRIAVEARYRRLLAARLEDDGEGDHEEDSRYHRCGTLMARCMTRIGKFDAEIVRSMDQFRHYHVWHKGWLFALSASCGRPHVSRLKVWPCPPAAHVYHVPPTRPWEPTDAEIDEAAMHAAIADVIGVRPCS
jgi:hypothetical protein